MKVAADTLIWHDANVDAIHADENVQRLLWDVEVFRWDMQEYGDAQPGQLTFEGVESIETLHDLEDALLEGPVDWEVLDARFEQSEGRTRYHFLLNLPRVVNERGGRGYGEFIITCQNAWFSPA